MEIGDDFVFCILYFYFWPEEPAAPVLTSPADSLRDSRYGPRRGRTQQAGAAPHGLGADAPQEDQSLRTRELCDGITHEKWGLGVLRCGGTMGE